MKWTIHNDTLYKVMLDGREVILHVEFQKVPDKNIAKQSFEELREKDEKELLARPLQSVQKGDRCAINPQRTGETPDRCCRRPGSPTPGARPQAELSRSDGCADRRTDGGGARWLQRE